MKEIDIKRIDLNLLKVFVAIYEQQSVTAAGDRLGLAQSSISHSLRRLRESFGDQLFVRTTTGMQPTQVAQLLYEPVSGSMKSLQSAFDKNGHFDPSQSSRNFNIIMTDVSELTFLPGIRKRVEALGSEIRIIALHVDRSQYRDFLEKGAADLAIGMLPTGHGDFMQQLLFDQSFSLYLRAGHPKAKGMSLDDFLEAEHLVVGPPALAELHVKKALGYRAAQRRIAVQVRNYLVAPFIIEQTNLVALLPQTIRKLTQGMDTIVELPPPIEIAPITLHQFWHERSNNDAGCRWLRSEIADLFQSRSH